MKKIKMPVLIFVFLFITFLSYAQTGRGQGRINGVVLDADGRPLEGAIIVATHLASGTTFKTTTAKDGTWAILGLGTGDWKITASKKGYVSASVVVYVRQLRKNPPIEFRLPKGIEAMAKDLRQEKIEKLSKFLEAGNNLYQQGKYMEAVEEFKKIIQEAPELYQIKINIGNCYLKAGKYDEAIKYYQEVLNTLKEKDPSFAVDKRAASKSLSGLGEAYIKKGDMQKGFEYFKKSVDLVPNDEIAAYNVGVILFNNMNSEEAIKYFELAIKIKPDWPKPYQKLGYAYINKGDYKKAIEAFEKYLQLYPDAPDKADILSMLEELRKLAK